MKTVDWRLLRDDGDLVLVTAEEAMPGLEVKMADFRDTHGLYYSPLKAWMGISRVGVQLGTAVPRMERGLWYVARDEALCEANQDLEPRAEFIVLRRIG